MLALAVMVAANASSTYAVVELSKDTKISGAGLMTTIEGKAVQVASYDQEPDPDSRMVSRKTGEPIRTASSGKTTALLTSKVPDRYLAELTHFEYDMPESDPVQTVFVKVESFKRIPKRGALCGSIVSFMTSDGNYTLDDEHLYSTANDGIEVPAFGQFDSQRRLDASHGRRLQVAAISGLFNFIKSTKFECYTEWKGKREEVEPARPKLPVSFTAFVDRACVAEHGIDRNRCIPRSSFDYSLKPGASDDATTMQLVKRVLITSDTHYEISYYPNHPGQREVLVTHKSGQVLKYQLYEDHPDMLYCNLLAHTPRKAFDERISKDSFLSYLGTTQHTRNGKTSTLRRWHVTLADENGGKLNSTQTESGALSSLEMWEDKVARHTFQIHHCAIM